MNQSIMYFICYHGVSKTDLSMLPWDKYKVCKDNLFLYINNEWIYVAVDDIIYYFTGDKAIKLYESIQLIKYDEDNYILPEVQIIWVQAFGEELVERINYYMDRNIQLKICL